MSKPSTDEQQAIYEATASTKDNLIIEASAGTGKTYMLESLGPALKGKNVLYLVFNVRNAKEAKERMPYNYETKTLNGFGHGTWMQTIGHGVALNKTKTKTIFKELVDEAPKSARSEMWECYDVVYHGVSMAKALGYAPPSYPQAQALIKKGDFHAALDEVPDDLAADLIDEVLTRSIAAAYRGTIDYDDQIYMPALFKATYTKYPIVLVDELQDLSPVQHEMLRRIGANRVIGVGDTCQNIYGFRGAKTRGMEEAKARFEMKEFPLSISFRCPEAIVRHVHWRVPTFRWSKTGGHVEKPTKLANGDIPDNATIICRNNAPLLRTAFSLLRSGRSVSVAGSDIGPRVVGTMRRLGPETLGRHAVLTAIGEWLEKKLEAESRTAQDLADCMSVFAQQGDTLGDAIRYAEHIFKAEGSILLTTGHKAKGLEWPWVLHLDPWLVRGTRSDEQNQNLDYVISTRSSDRLIEIDSSQIEW